MAEAGEVTYEFTEYDRREFIRMRRKIDGVRGPGVSHTPDTITINAPQRRPPPSFGESSSDELPVGQYAGQQYMNVTSNGMGFDFDWLLPDP